MDEKKRSSEQENLGPEEAPLMETELKKLSAVSDMPKSQALLDIEASDAEARSTESGKSSGSSGAPQNLAVIARFRWVLLFVLSLAALLFWTAEAQVSGRPYKFIALGYLALSLILTIPSMKFLRIPTRSGLAAFLWAGTFFISALYGPDEGLFDGSIPAALTWGGLLVMILLWMGVAVWRKIGRYKVIDIVLSVIIVYAALGPVLALVESISGGTVLSLTFQALNASPAFLSNNLPWFLWPMTLILLLLLPLCALFSLWDQMSVLKRRGARHGGNFFLALAFLLIIPYGFFSYGQGVAEMPEIAGALRSISPVDQPAILPEPEPTVTIIEPVSPPEAVEPQPPVIPPVTEPEEDTLPPLTHEGEAPTAPVIIEEAPQSSPLPTPPQAPEEVTPSPEPALPATPEETLANLENELSAAKNRIDVLENRLDQLSRELEQLKGNAPAPVIPAPPDEPPAEERMRETPGFSSAT